MTVRDGRGGESSDTLRVTIAPKPEVVIYASYVWDLRAPWTTVFDPTAAPVGRLYYPNLGGLKITAPEAVPRPMPICISRPIRPRPTSCG